MPLISKIGRRQPGMRRLIWAMYSLLTLGAVTMVYPFLLMLSGSTKSAVDGAGMEVVPRYLVDDTALYRKHLAGLYNESDGAMQQTYGLWVETFSKLSPPRRPSPLLDDWEVFLRDNRGRENSSWFVLGYFFCPASRGVVPHNLSKLRAELLKEEGGIEAVNLRYGTAFPSVSAFQVIPPNYLNRYLDFPDTDFLRRVDGFELAQPSKWRCYVDLGNFYRRFLQMKYGATIGEYNAAKGTTFPDWSDVPAGDSLAACGPESRADFDEYVRRMINPVFLKVDPSVSPLYRDYLKRKYAGSLETLNSRYETQYARFEEIPFPERMSVEGVARSDWKGFLEGWRDPRSLEVLGIPIEAIKVTGPDFAFRDYLKEKYGSLETLNRTLATDFGSWTVVPMPQQEWQYREFLKMKGWLRWQFTIQNYVDVWNYLAVNGRGLLNTLIFCALSILAQLTVNPMAAYALSRFKPRSTYRILLFLMMTMAFPGMVTQIPVFLLLRDLGMLNTFWALVLPGLANGFSIFLLKGFFDSLPRELYESAEIDGAPELVIFWNITMALSRPILAVIALGAFTSAYAAFMFALLLCQDPKMWTLMVWLYQLQGTSGQGIIFASLIISAIPTLAVFIACQNIIMRGIVVPVEK